MSLAILQCDFHYFSFIPDQLLRSIYTFEFKIITSSLIIMNLQDIEKGHAELPLDPGKALAEILRLTVSNQAMLNTLLTITAESNHIFNNPDEAMDYIEKLSSERFNQLWADVLSQVTRK